MTAYLTGQSDQMLDPHFVHHSNLPEPLTNGLKQNFEFGEEFAEIFDLRFEKNDFPGSKNIFIILELFSKMKNVAPKW